MKRQETQPTISVGILRSKVIRFTLHGDFRPNSDGSVVTGDQTVSVQDGKILYNNDLYDEVIFSPSSTTDSFDLLDVVIGIHFHWERKETQRFNGSLKFIVIEGEVQAIDIVPTEDYLTSVISSEMSATSSLELLKAHAVISRSWLLNKLENKETESHADAMVVTDERIIRWYDHQDHTLFDVCADDHCQRYQGITKASTQAVREAIKATFGEVLTYDGKICDARFYKACGGATELFENCWEEVHHPYLLPVADSAQGKLPDLTQEAVAREWILSSPEAYCNTHDKTVLSQVLNNYDQETPDFYRWKVDYSQEELSSLVKEKMGIDFGKIIDLIPLRRGASARIIELKIVGEKRTMVVGKELEIRKALSTSHLYSSAFVVEKEEREGILHFILRGAGWGHGVGLCQIGAAVMASQGIGYRSILSHYYPHSSLTKRY
ncbi:MAG: SpoIID/LytB domain-containing protein [Paludibacteraceae bacterium]|nr:SpoIID/LytB domain-containing protein [Paludibacteraceae bacterium]MBP5481172.1 SpoIID/LytB domain-containing protein [Paludibacteraceae bacterium]